jgi:hypothetical protein
MSVAEVGLMFNLGRLNALGPTVQFSVQGAYETLAGFGLSLRYRRWFSSDISLNLSAGGQVLTSAHGGFIGHIDLNYKDYVAPFLGWDFVADGPTGETIWQAGVRTGSYPGLVGIGVGLVIGMMVWASTQS